MFTPEGLDWLGNLAGPALSGAVIAVGDGDSARAERPVESAELDGTTIVLRTTFGEDEANFDWQVREVMLDGKVIDRTEADSGRKAQGNVWSAEVRLELAAEE